MLIKIVCKYFDKLVVSLFPPLENIQPHCPTAQRGTHCVVDDINLQEDDSFGRTRQLLIFQHVAPLLTVSDLTEFKTNTHAQKQTRKLTLRVWSGTLQV